MLDVIFLLLIFFMTASAFREQDRAIDVSVPEAETAADQASPLPPVIVTVTADGTVYLGAQAHTLGSLKTALAELREVSPNQAVLIRGDEASRLGTTVAVLDAVRAVGFTNAQLAASQRPE